MARLHDDEVSSRTGLDDAQGRAQLGRLSPAPKDAPTQRRPRNATGQRQPKRLILRGCLIAFAVVAVLGIVSSVKPEPERRSTKLIPASAIPKPTANPVLSRLVELAIEARRLQTPSAALAHWGDPSSIHGTLSPEIEFDRPGPNGSWRVTLIYGPPAKAPRQLESVNVSVDSQGGRAVSEQQIINWLGSPTRITDRPRPGTLDYDTDAANLGVWFIYKNDSRSPTSFSENWYTINFRLSPVGPRT